MSDVPQTADPKNARRYALHRALYEWKDYGGPIEDVLEAIGEYVIGVLDEHVSNLCGTCGELHAEGAYYNHNFVRRAVTRTTPRP